MAFVAVIGYVPPVVLGEIGLAEQALTRGPKVFADDPPERDRIAGAAQQLRLSQ